MVNKFNINNVEKNYGTTTVFQNYKVTLNNNIVFFVPLDEANTDYQEIQEWIADGGTVIDNGGEE
tara:strand:- start:163 stop:357 length:195 start_codon:yes stop_codon:yes gene_type:complete